MFEDGADIIDIGGESTRPPGKTYGPGAQAITEQEEMDRVLPVIERLCKEIPEIVISIDTTKSSVASQAVTLGAKIINDVSAGTKDNLIFEIAAKHNVPIILMHGYGPQFTKQRIEDYRYDSVVDDVMDYLYTQIEEAKRQNVKEVLADVGIGFAKVFEDNMSLLKHHEEFKKLGVPLVLGASRKSSIGRALGRDTKPNERVIGSVSAAVYGAMHGADIIRVHDVKETRDALAVLKSIQLAE
jgi:dihydropteroate synthase